MFNNKILLEVCKKSKDQASSGRFAILNCWSYIHVLTNINIRTPGTPSDNICPSLCGIINPQLAS
jgi:hypothetical protein